MRCKDIDARDNALGDIACMLIKENKLKEASVVVLATLSERNHAYIV